MFWKPKIFSLAVVLTCFCFVFKFQTRRLVNVHEQILQILEIFEKTRSINAINFISFQRHPLNTLNYASMEWPKNKIVGHS